MTTELADDVPDIPSNKDFSTLQTNFALSPKRKKDSENGMKVYLFFLLNYVETTKIERIVIFFCVECAV